jgi:hypothetical protein
MKTKLLLVLLLVMPAAAQTEKKPKTNPVIVTLAPNTTEVRSGETVEYFPQVINTTNTSVTWYVCGGTMDPATNIWTAPAVTATTSYCVTAISVADPSKSSTAIATVDPTAPPPTFNGCVLPGTIPAPVPPVSNGSQSSLYGLPAWITALNFTGPGDIVYGGNATVPTTQADEQRWFIHGNVNTQYCMWFTAGGGKPPYTITGKSLPPGLTMQMVTIPPSGATVGAAGDTVGLLSGIPTKVGTWTQMVFTLTDSVGTVNTLAARSLEICPTQDANGVTQTTCTGFGTTGPPARSRR